MGWHPSPSSPPDYIRPFPQPTPVIPATHPRHSRVGGNPPLRGGDARESTAPTPNAPLPPIPTPQRMGWHPRHPRNPPPSFPQPPSSFPPDYIRNHSRNHPRHSRILYSSFPRRRESIGGAATGAGIHRCPRQTHPFRQSPPPHPPWFPVFTGMTDGLASFSITPTTLPARLHSPIPATTSVIPASLPVIPTTFPIIPARLHSPIPETTSVIPA